ncbi:MAG TPA: DNA polymerase III subunit delta' [Accumulibacter sp.]|nr:DNA polymerase III subunit delta' [Accumulibacter sp.]HMW17425.1 DNA polymerase III subunit delta' [Accumulibacter sp.]HMX22027.1 DNA polymerase III subunit delta' [Accumulibacter sp.]HMY07152.1 DNA polymerase III subunit delta' [Accumulibacter sp.]HNC17804.1 DNA polymerase III subunit delta' [Accumulibacter sp.]
MRIDELYPHIWQPLLQRRAQLPHALLFIGQRGLGKFALGKAIAAALLCEQPGQAGEACGQCPACGWQAQGHHPDFRLLQPAAAANHGSGETDSAVSGDGGDGGERGTAGEDSGKTVKKKASQWITIDQVRGLEDFLHVGTHRQGARVVLINPAEAMNRAAANALLKALEEPLPGTVFLLMASEAHRLLPTIRSRCQTIPVLRPAHAVAVEWLKQAAVTDAERWLALAGGAPFLALELAGSGEKTLFDAWLAQAVRAAEGEVLACAAELDKVLKADPRPGAVKRLIEWAQKWLHDLLLAGRALPPRYYLEQQALLQRLAGRSETRKLLAFNRKTLQYRAQSEQPLNNRLFLEEFFAGYSSLFRR